MKKKQKRTFAYSGERDRVLDGYTILMLRTYERTREFSLFKISSQNNIIIILGRIVLTIIVFLLL